jgi:hypothetical protein
MDGISECGIEGLLLLGLLRERLLISECKSVKWPTAYLPRKSAKGIEVEAIAAARNNGVE